MRDEPVFRAAYRRTARAGHSDAPGGAEYWRVLREWIEAGRPREVYGFIRWRAYPTEDGSAPPWFDAPKK
jgi:hypothetical protein